MKTTKLRSKRAIIATTAAVVVALGAGGAVRATAANADVSGTDRDRVGAAAVQAVGGGTVLDVETSDDPGQAYEVEVRKADGTEVDVALDQDLKVLTQEADAADDADDATDTPDRVLSDAERTSAGKAAVDAVGAGATVTSIEAGDAGEPAYEVDVRLPDNTEWDVTLDAGFKVLNKTADN